MACSDGPRNALGRGHAHFSCCDLQAAIEIMNRLSKLDGVYRMIDVLVTQKGEISACG